MSRKFVFKKSSGETSSLTPDGPKTFQNPTPPPPAKFGVHSNGQQAPSSTNLKQTSITTSMTAYSSSSSYSNSYPSNNSSTGVKPATTLIEKLLTNKENINRGQINKPAQAGNKLVLKNTIYYYYYYYIYFI